MSNLDDPTTQIAILNRVKRAIAPLCGALPSVNYRTRAQKIYLLAKELSDDIRNSTKDESA